MSSHVHIKYLRPAAGGEGVVGGFTSEEDDMLVRLWQRVSWQEVITSPAEFPVTKTDILSQSMMFS